MNKFPSVIVSLRFFCPHPMSYKLKQLINITPTNVSPLSSPQSQRILKIKPHTFDFSPKPAPCTCSTAPPQYHLHKSRPQTVCFPWLPGVSVQGEDQNLINSYPTLIWQSRLSTAALATLTMPWWQPGKARPLLAAFEVFHLRPGGLFELLFSYDSSSTLHPHQLVGGSVSRSAVVSN